MRNCKRVSTLGKLRTFDLGYPPSPASVRVGLRESTGWLSHPRGAGSAHCEGVQGMQAPNVAVQKTAEGHLLKTLRGQSSIPVHGNVL